MADELVNEPINNRSTNGTSTGDGSADNEPTDSGSTDNKSPEIPLDTLVMNNHKNFTNHKVLISWDITEGMCILGYRYIFVLH